MSKRFVNLTKLKIALSSWRQKVKYKIKIQSSFRVRKTRYTNSITERVHFPSMLPFCDR